MSAVASRCASDYRSDIVSGENSVLLYGRNEHFDGKSPLVIYCHGSGGTELEPITTYTNGATYAQYLAAHGFIVISTLGATQLNWGNDASKTALESLVTWAQSHGAKSGAIGLYGISMGFTTITTYWNGHPTNVGAVVAASPVCNTSNVYTDNSGLRAGMDAAYAGNFAANGASRSPHLILPNVSGAGSKLRLYYSDLDATCRPADITGLATSLGATATDIEPATPSGHQSAVSASIPQAEILSQFSVLK